MWTNNNGAYNRGSPNPPTGSGFIMPSADPYARRSGATPEPPAIPPRPSDRGVFDAPGEDYRSRGEHHHHHHHHQSGTPGFAGNFPGAGGFAPPGGPPPGRTSPYNAPAGPPPGVYSPPGGPPPNMSYGFSSPPGPPPRSQYNSGYGNEWQDQSYRPDFEYVQPGEPIGVPTSTQYYGPQYGGGQEQPAFAWSQCNGKKKALIIGINYIGTDQELNGCINDARNMKEFIKKMFDYQEDDIVVLTDDARKPEQQPTRANMIRAMQWLVRNAAPNDSLFFHYSGHGGLTKDLDGDEAEGYDEVIYPVDFKSAGHIVDDEMHDIMVKPLPLRCRLTAIFDSCHSGTALDLPYVYSTEGKIKEPNLYAEAGKSVLSAGMSYARKDYSGMLQGLKGLANVAMGNEKRAEDLSRRTKSSPADVISWSGCKDSQTSADTSVNGQGTGAMSWAFTTSLRRNPHQSYQQLLVSIRSMLQAKYSQKPQLSSSHPMDTNVLFIA